LNRKFWELTWKIKSTKKFGRTSQSFMLLNRHKTTQRNNEKNPSFIYCWTTLIIFTANLKLTQKTSIRQTNSKLKCSFSVPDWIPQYYLSKCKCTSTQYLCLLFAMYCSRKLKVQSRSSVVIIARPLSTDQ
jgi:hypothetical protein